jgi:hypothetical protein
MKLFNLSDFERDMLNEKVLKYAREEFSYQKTVDLWHDSMIQAIENFKNYKKWERITF